jgi:hypothetical protein
MVVSPRLQDLDAQALPTVMKKVNRPDCYSIGATAMNAGNFDDQD